MLHGVYAAVDGELVQWVSAQDGMPGCKLGLWLSFLTLILALTDGLAFLTDDGYE